MLDRGGTAHEGVLEGLCKEACFPAQPVVSTSWRWMSWTDSCSRDDDAQEHEVRVVGTVHGYSVTTISNPSWPSMVAAFSSALAKVRSESSNALRFA